MKWRWKFASIAQFVLLRERWINCKGLLARLQTAKKKFLMKVFAILAPALNWDSHQPLTMMGIQYISHSKHSLPCYFTAFYCHWVRSACSFTVSASPAPYKRNCRASSRVLGRYCSDVHVQVTILTLSSRIVCYRWYRYLITKQIISPYQFRCIYNTNQKVVGLYFTLRTFTGETPISLLAFLANLKNTFDRFGTCEGKAVWVYWVPAYLLGNDAREEYYAYSTIGMSTDAIYYCKPWVVFITTLIIQFMNRNMLLEAHDLVSWAFHLAI